MATIQNINDTAVWRIRKFLGLNENPDGDTSLKNGEFSELRNFKITKDNHLQSRPGTRTVTELFSADGETGAPNEETRCHGFWRGFLGGYERTLAAWNGGIFEVNTTKGTATRVGTMTAAETSFFSFRGKVYALNGHEYKSWDGTGEFADVEGYAPIVLTAANPDGTGTLLEEVNRLCGWKRIKYSPDGKASEFQLPETNVDEITEVYFNGRKLEPLTETGGDGEMYTGDYEADTERGTVKLEFAPSAGTNTLEVKWKKGEGARGEVLGMRYCELYNGTSDARVFLYGDGSNKAIYSGIENDSGQPSAEYFPDLYEASVGDDAPLTALVRHYSRLLAFKANSAWTIQYGNTTLEDGRVTAAFYVQPVNRQFGNDAPGQVHLLENNPLTFDAGSVYQWQSSSVGYISTAENNAKRISARVGDSLSRFAADKVKTFNRKSQQEYWFIQEGTALILNYGNDTWYRYENIPFVYMVEEDRETYGLCHDGRIVRFSRDYRNDDGAEIDCYAATGSMSFDRDWLRKYCPLVFVSMEPESGARITVTAESDRRSDYPEKAVAYNLANFSHVDFNHFSFATNRKPKTKRLKIKVKKAAFYRLVFRLKSASATATVIETDVQVRTGGTVK